MNQPIPPHSTHTRYARFNAAVIRVLSRPWFLIPVVYFILLGMFYVINPSSPYPYNASEWASPLRLDGAFQSTTYRGSPMNTDRLPDLPKHKSTQPILMDLANGMRVVWLPDNRAPVFTQMVMFKAGSIDEVPGKTGLAHFLEHLMFRGHKTGLSFLENLGGDLNAYTTYDRTAYHLSAPTSYLKDLIGFETKRMSALAFEDEEFVLEKQIVQAERRQRTENNPVSAGMETMQTILFGNRPLGQPIIGWMQDIEKLTPEDIKEFYAKHYQPTNAIYAITGKVDADQLRALVEENFGKLPNSSPLTTQSSIGDVPDASARSIPSQQKLEIHHESVSTPLLIRSYTLNSLFPIRTQTQWQSYGASELMMLMLGRSRSGFLYERLVIERKLATSVYLYHDQETRNDGYVMIVAIARPGINHTELEAAIDQALKDFSQQPEAYISLEFAKRIWAYDEMFSQDAPFNRIDEISRHMLVGNDRSVMEDLTNNLATINIDMIHQAARTSFDSKFQASLWFHPAPAALNSSSAPIQ